MFLSFKNELSIDEIISRFPTPNFDYVVIRVKDSVPYRLTRTLDPSETVMDYREQIVMNENEALVIIDKSVNAEPLLKVAARYQGELVRFSQK